MNRLLIGSLTFVFATVLLGAQTPETPEPAGQEPDRVSKRAQQMREQLGTGKQLRSHVRVEVRLKNGNRLNGVVKDGRLVERVNGLRFVDAHAADKGAGIRLWYSGGMRNYVFVPFADLQTYNVLQRLTTEELAAIEAELQMQEVKRDEQLRKEIAARAQQDGKPPMPPVPGMESATAPDTESPADSQDQGAQPKAAPKNAPKSDAKAGKSGQKTEAEAVDSAQETQRKWFKLLQDYPPAQGWNASKRDEIARRFKVIGARPSASEQRFVDDYVEWQKACTHFAVDAKKATDGTEQPVESDDGSGRRSRKK